MECCPRCGYTEPTQNNFKPNVMTQYVVENTGEIVVLNDNEKEIISPKLGRLVRKDLYKPTSATGTPAPSPVSTPQKQAILPQKPIPTAAIKTPAEKAATPPAQVTATLPTTPVVNSPEQP